MRPSHSTLYRPRPQTFCYDCCQEGNFLRHSPQRIQYQSRFQHFVDITDASVYMLSHSDSDVYGFGHEKLASFADAEDSLFGDISSTDTADDEFDSCLCDLLNVIDNFGSTLNPLHIFLEYSANKQLWFSCHYFCHN